jgi:hypothetical protein
MPIHPQVINIFFNNYAYEKFPALGGTPSSLKSALTNLPRSATVKDIKNNCFQVQMLIIPRD